MWKLAQGQYSHYRYRGNAGGMSTVPGKLQVSAYPTEATTTTGVGTESFRMMFVSSTGTRRSKVIIIECKTKRKKGQLTADKPSSESSTCVVRSESLRESAKHPAETTMRKKRKEVCSDRGLTLRINSEGTCNHFRIQGWGWKK